MNNHKKVCDDCYIFHLPEYHNPYRQVPIPEYREIQTNKESERVKLGTKQTRSTPKHSELEAEMVLSPGDDVPHKRLKPAPTTEVGESASAMAKRLVRELHITPAVAAKIEQEAKEALSNADGPQVSEPTMPSPAPQEPAGSDVDDILWPAPFSGGYLKPTQVAVSSGLPPDGKVFTMTYHMAKTAIKQLLATEYQRGKADGAREREVDAVDTNARRIMADMLAHPALDADKEVKS